MACYGIDYDRLEYNISNENRADWNGARYIRTEENRIERNEI